MSLDEKMNITKDRRLMNFYTEDVKQSIKEFQKRVIDEVQINTVRKEKLGTIEIVNIVIKKVFGEGLI